MMFKDKMVVITSENICIDGGMTRQMIYHNDFGWSFDKSALGWMFPVAASGAS